MGQEKKTETNSRRKFLSLFTSSKPAPANTEKIKLLTADGKLMEVDKAVFEKASKNNKATNKEILHWMDNPSKEK